MKIITVNLPETYIKAIESLCGEDGKIYPSRSEMIRVAVREFLNKELEAAKAFQKQFGQMKEDGYVSFRIDKRDDDDFDNPEAFEQFWQKMQARTEMKQAMKTRKLAEVVAEIEKPEEKEPEKPRPRQNYEARRRRKPINNIYWDKSGPVPVRIFPEIKNNQEGQ